MRNVIWLMHASLDGFVAGPNGEMDWIKLDAALFDDVTKVTVGADAAIYGRITYEMMASYWPTAAGSPTATKHDIEHANWVNPAPKYVIWRTLQTADWANTHIIHDNVAAEIAQLKAQPGKNLLMLGSARTAREFIRRGLIDEYYINVNSVILGAGLPLFADLTAPINLKLVNAKTYASGVVGLHYRKRAGR